MCPEWSVTYVSIRTPRVGIQLRHAAPADTFLLPVEMGISNSLAFVDPATEVRSLTGQKLQADLVLESLSGNHSEW